MAPSIRHFLVLLFSVSKIVNGLNMNDILNVDYLPGTLLLDNVMLDGDNSVNTTTTRNITEGNWNDAFYTMNFHRKMMNEYLCRSYVAEEILSDMTATSSPRVDNRLGSPAEAAKDSKGTEAPGGHHGKPKKIDLSAVKDSLLADQGSSHYKNWLARTTTLEDIYRHYEDLASEDDGSHDSAHSVIPEYDGEVTGFAVHQTPASSYVPGKTGHSGGGGGSGGGGSGHGYGGDSGHSYSSFGGGTSYSSSGGPSTGYSYHPSDKSDKGMALKDLFEIALTALAFLSFGLFKLNVIMCIFGGNGSMTTTVAEEVNRQRRSAQLQRAAPETLNAMSHRVLKSIEAFLAMQHDDGECLRLSMCDNNRFSRKLTGTDRIWLPVWSLGLSWVAGRFSPSQHASTAMLEYLRASVMGLGNSQCELLFHRCSMENIAKIRNDRRKRRRRRRHGDPGDL